VCLAAEEVFRVHLNNELIRTYNFLPRGSDWHLFRKGFCVEFNEIENSRGQIIKENPNLFMNKGDHKLREIRVVFQ
jgi:hypothetical protein